MHRQLNRVSFKQLDLQSIQFASLRKGPSTRGSAVASSERLFGHHAALLWLDRGTAHLMAAETVEVRSAHFLTTLPLRPYKTSQAIGALVIAAARYFGAERVHRPCFAPCKE